MLEERQAQAEDGGLTGSDSQDDVPEPSSVTYIDYEDPFAFTGDNTGAPHVRKLSPNAWVGCGGEVYLLECMGKGYIRIEFMEDPEDGSCAARLFTLIRALTPLYRRGEPLRSVVYSCNAARRNCLHARHIPVPEK